jgi:ATP-dependent phosphofructokinase / diphosphate-dependent phosphofructokinase
MGTRIGIITGGGDAPGLNAVIRAIVKAAALRGWECIGFLDGFEGLLHGGRFMPLDYLEMGSLLYRGGTILGTTNRGHFAAKTGHGDVHRVPPEIMAEALDTFKKLELRALVVIGGDGSLTIAQQLYEAGIPLVGVPKTIDNDLGSTLMTFGFESAVACAVDALDRLHSTAESHDRIMVLEVMGRYAGWIALQAGLAGGADVILIPEIEFDYDAICRKVLQRDLEGKQFSIVIAAEGARPKGGVYVTRATSDDTREAKLGGVGMAIATELEARTGHEARCVILGHLQRGGAPSPWDRQLCTRFGVLAVECIAQGKFGTMVAMTPEGMAPVNLAGAISKIRRVPPDGEMVQVARALGITFGDR